jgi:hypothetical protein
MPSGSSTGPSGEIVIDEQVRTDNPQDRSSNRAAVLQSDHFFAPPQRPASYPLPRHSALGGPLPRTLLAADGEAGRC